MALDDTWNVVFPDQIGGTGDTNALTITDYEARVLTEIERVSKVTQLFTPQLIARGTDSLTTYAFGASSQPQKVVPGAAPDGQASRSGKIALTVDELIIQRHIFPLLEEWQSRLDVRQEIGRYHGRTIAKFIDQTYAIIGTKAALASTTPVAGQGTATGFHGGSQVTFAATSDATDPGAFVAALNALFVKFYQKDVDPVTDGLGLLVRPDEFAVLSDADALINGDYITSAGNTLQGIPMLKHKGVPIVQSTNLPFGTTVTGHTLSNARNGNAYDGDFTKVRALVVGSEAVLAGNVIPVTSNGFYSDDYLQWVVQSYTSFGAGVRRPEYAGCLLIP